MRNLPSSRKIITAAIVAAFALVACKSERAAKFEKESAAVCACTDVACAKKAGATFVASYEAVMKEDIDWQSSSGKKDSASITQAGKAHNTCLSKFESRDAANKACTEDAKGKSNTAGCTSCCREHGRVFDYWVDPMAAGLVGAFGGPKNKGCGCK